MVNLASFVQEIATAKNMVCLYTNLYVVMSFIDDVVVLIRYGSDLSFKHRNNGGTITQSFVHSVCVYKVTTFSVSHFVSRSADDGSSRAAHSHRSRGSSRDSGHGMTSFDSEEVKHRDGRPHVDRNAEPPEETIQKLRLANQALRRQVQQLNSALEEAHAFGQRRGSVSSRQGSEGANAERRRLLQELSNRDRQIRTLKKKMEGMHKALQNKKEQVERTMASDAIMNMENEKRDLQRQLAAMADENKALRNMQRQLVKKIDEQEQANDEFPQRLASLSEDVRSLKERLRTAQANESKAKQDYDKQRERLMNMIDQNRELKAKLRNMKQKVNKKGGKNLSPSSSTASSPQNSPGSRKNKAQSQIHSNNHIPVQTFRAAEEEWNQERQQLFEHIQTLEKQLSEARRQAQKAPGENSQAVDDRFSKEDFVHHWHEREQKSKQIQQSQIASYAVQPPEQEQSDQKQSSWDSEMPSWYKKASLNQVKPNQGSRVVNPDNHEANGHVSQVQYHGSSPGQGSEKKGKGRGLEDIDYSNLASSGNEDDYGEDFDDSGDDNIIAALNEKGGSTTQNNKAQTTSTKKEDDSDLPPWLREDADDDVPVPPAQQDPFAKPEFGAKKKNEYESLFL